MAVDVQPEHLELGRHDARRLPLGQFVEVAEWRSSNGASINNANARSRSGIGKLSTKAWNAGCLRWAWGPQRTAAGEMVPDVRKRMIETHPLKT